MIFGLFKSKERKDVESALQQLLEALNVAKRIIEIDSERFPTSVLLAAEKFNHHNVKGLSMLYAIAKHYNWPEELDTELDNSGAVVSPVYSGPGTANDCEFHSSSLEAAPSPLTAFP